LRESRITLGGSARSRRSEDGGLVAHLQLGHGEQAVDDHVPAQDAIVDQLATAGRPDDKQRRHLAFADPSGELDEHLAPVIEGAHGLPGRVVAGDGVAKVQRRDVDAAGHRLSLGRCGVLAPQGSCG
jgi:hypothetical protein